MTNFSTIMPLIAPSILAADFTQLGAAIDLINRSDADWVHCDVMDGSFVPNISFGLPIIEAVRRVSRKPLDVHLMIEAPERYLEDFKQAGADRLTVHVEATRHLDRTLRAIQQMGLQAGVALNPATPLDSIQHVLPWVDQVLLMTVNPGFGGQSFIPYVLEKVRRLHQMVASVGSNALIEVDGGVDAHTAPDLCQMGAEVLVAGSYVFKAVDPLAAIAHLKGLDRAQLQV
jgi:ribulose-phosphate 3-epimerase